MRAESEEMCELLHTSKLYISAYSDCHPPPDPGRGKVHITPHLHTPTTSLGTFIAVLSHARSEYPGVA